MIVRKMMGWFRLGDAQDRGTHPPHGSDLENSAKGMGHTHGVIDAAVSTSERGLWAITWSFAVLVIAAGLQFTVVLISGSVALLADMIHNVGDAVTAIPLGIAFVLALMAMMPITAAPTP